MKINLPDLRWLVSRHEGRFVTNTYSGSAGTLSDGGCVSTRTFNYKVYVDISGGNESDFRLIAESCIIQPWHLGGKKTDPEKLILACTEDGVAQAAEWLTEVSAKYGF